MDKMELSELNEVYSYLEGKLKEIRKILEYAFIVDNGSYVRHSDCPVSVASFYLKLYQKSYEEDICELENVLKIENDLVDKMNKVQKILEERAQKILNKL